MDWEGAQGRAHASKLKPPIRRGEAGSQTSSLEHPNVFAGLLSFPSRRGSDNAAALDKAMAWMGWGLRHDRIMTSSRSASLVQLSTRGLFSSSSNRAAVLGDVSEVPSRDSSPWPSPFAPSGIAEASTVPRIDVRQELTSLSPLFPTASHNYFGDSVGTTTGQLPPDHDILSHMNGHVAHGDMAPVLSSLEASLSATAGTPEAWTVQNINSGQKWQSLLSTFPAHGCYLVEDFDETSSVQQPLGQSYSAEHANLDLTNRLSSTAASPCAIAWTPTPSTAQKKHLEQQQKSPLSLFPAPDWYLVGDSDAMTAAQHPLAQHLPQDQSIPSHRKSNAVGHADPDLIALLSSADGSPCVPTRPPIASTAEKIDSTQLWQSSLLLSQAQDWYTVGDSDAMPTARHPLKQSVPSQENCLPQEELSTDMYSYLCSQCDRCFLDSSALAQHVSREHPPTRCIEGSDRSRNLQDSGEMEMPVSPVYMVRSVYSCGFPGCGLEFDDEGEMKKHFCRAHGGRSNAGLGY